MKKLSIISVFLIFFVISINAMARERTLIRGRIESGGFGGPILKVTELNNEAGLLIGGRGGWIINHTLVLGGGGYGLVTNIEAPVEFWYRESRSRRYHPYETLYLNFGYGGGILEFIIASDQVIHLAANTLVGAGGISYGYRDWDYYYYDEYDFYDDFYNDAFFVVEPGVDLMLNVTRNFRIGFGLSYRYLYDVEIKGLNNEVLTGPSANLTFKFGSF